MDGIKTCFILVVILAVLGSYQCGRFGGSSSNDDENKLDIEVTEASLRVARHLTTSRSRSATARRTTPRRIHTTPRPRPITRTTPRRTTTRRTTTRRTTTRSTTRHTTTPRHMPTIRYTPTTPRPTSRKTTTIYTTKPTWYPVTTKSTTRYTTKPIWYPVTTKSTTRYTTKPTPYPIRTKSTTRYTTRRKIITTPKPTWPIVPPPPGSGGEPVKIKIVNKYNYHYPGYYTLPVQHAQYSGFYQTHSTYTYTPTDTGSGVLGFYLGYKLAKLTTPTYAHETFYDGYRPRYDHYTVHHYYHNKEAVPPRQEIQSNVIVGCVGDSREVCPTNTTSLCTNDGRLMCVVPVTQTVSCSDDNRLNCSKSLVSCVNNTAPECAGSKSNNTLVTIPCLSTAKIYGNITFVNNTVITNDTAPSTNLTSTTTTTTTPRYSTLYNIPEATPETTTSVHWKWKRAVPQSAAVLPQEFCVTVVAVPAQKVETEGEKVFKDAKHLLNKFFESVWIS